MTPEQLSAPVVPERVTAQNVQIVWDEQPLDSDGVRAEDVFTINGSIEPPF
jgi:hypothetical protein